MSRKGTAFPAEWQNIIDKMYLPYDSEHDRYMAHDRDQGHNTRQADTSLAIFPIECKELDAEARKRILDACTEKYDIMMGSAINAIGRCEQKQPKLAWNELVQTVTDHIEETFCQTREKWHNNTTYFLTGLGGFLQLFIYGFAGLRIRENGFVVNPCIPPQIGDHIRLKGLHHKGVCFDMIVTKNDGPIYVSKEVIDQIKFFSPDGIEIRPYPLEVFIPEEAQQDVVASVHKTLLVQQASKTSMIEGSPCPQPEIVEVGYQYTC